MDEPLHARLINGEGELIAEGRCWLDEPARSAMLEPEREPGVLQKERGALALQLESGRSLAVSDTPMIFRLRSAAGAGGRDARRKLYRLRLIDAHDAAATGAAEQDAPAGQEDGPPRSGRGAPAAP